MRAIAITTGIAAAICLFLLLPWSLGVPGMDGTPYARGWFIGFTAILSFPAVAVLLAIGAYFAPENLWIARLRVAALAALAAMQAVAWWILLR